METGEKIKTAGLKVTPQRRAVYEAMKKLCHAPIEEVVKEVQGVSPDINVSTVYRIMDLFSVAGLLSKISHPNGKIYYDINTYEHHHIFKISGAVVDYEDEELTALIKARLKAKVGSDIKIERISIQIVTSEN